MNHSPWRVRRCTRVCAASGQVLPPGTPIVSVLSEAGDEFIRKDYAVDAWPGRPEDAVAVWFHQVPHADQPTKPTIPDDLIVDWFVHLEPRTEILPVALRAMLGYWLVRKRRFSFEAEAPQGFELSQETLSDTPRWRWVRDVRTQACYQFQDPPVDAALATTLEQYWQTQWQAVWRSIDEGEDWIPTDTTQTAPEVPV